MSEKKPRRYSGGIHDAQTLMDRCRIDPITECWAWRLSVVQGAPKVHFRMPDTSLQMMRGRRVAAYLKTGIFPEGKYAAPTEDCHNPNCVNPEHARWVDRATWACLCAERGIFKDRPAKVKANREVAKSRRALSPDQVEEVRTSSDSAKQLAKQFGVSGSTINAIRQNLRYRDSVAVARASVFTWRP